MDRTKSPYETIEHHGADFVVSLSAIAEAIIGGALGIREVSTFTKHSPETLIRAFKQPGYGPFEVMLAVSLAAGFDQIDVPGMLTSLHFDDLEVEVTYQVGHILKTSDDNALIDLRRFLRMCTLCEVIRDNTKLSNESIRGIVEIHEALWAVKFNSFWNVGLDMDRAEVTRLLVIIGLTVLGKPLKHALGSRFNPSRTDALIKDLEEKLRT